MLFGIDTYTKSLNLTKGLDYKDGFYIEIAEKLKELNYKIKLFKLYRKNLKLVDNKWARGKKISWKTYKNLITNLPKYDYSIIGKSTDFLWYDDLSEYCFEKHFVEDWTRKSQKRVNKEKD